MSCSVCGHFFIHFCCMIYTGSYPFSFSPRLTRSTIRTTWSHRHELSLGVDGELAKDKEIIKIDTLKGEVKPSTFEQIFDNIEKKARRSTSCF